MIIKKSGKYHFKNLKILGIENDLIKSTNIKNEDFFNQNKVLYSIYIWNIAKYFTSISINPYK